MERKNTLFGSPMTASSCLFCSGNADTVAVKAKAAAMVLVKCIIPLIPSNIFLVRKKMQIEHYWKVYSFGK
jgi:hypothetical protein